MTEGNPDPLPAPPCARPGPPARLNHPAVVTIFDVVEADGSPWIVMELVEARSLDQVLTEDGPTAAASGRRSRDAGARRRWPSPHAAGILHRDVKPQQRAARARQPGRADRLRHRHPRGRTAASPGRDGDGHPGFHRAGTHPRRPGYTRFRPVVAGGDPVRRGGRARTLRQPGQLHRDPGGHRQRGSAAAPVGRPAVPRHRGPAAPEPAGPSGCCRSRPTTGRRRGRSLHRRRRPAASRGRRPAARRPAAPGRREARDPGPGRRPFPARGSLAGRPVGRCPLAGGHAAGRHAGPGAGGRNPRGPESLGPQSAGGPVAGPQAGRHGAPAPDSGGGSPPNWR